MKRYTLAAWTKAPVQAARGTETGLSLADARKHVARSRFTSFSHLPDGASIILNASVVGSKGLPANSVYAATKAAVLLLLGTTLTGLGFANRWRQRRQV